MAPLVAIIGGVGWLTVTHYKDFKPSPPIISLFAFLFWAAITSLWSPYETENLLSNPFKLIVGVCLFLGAFHAIKAVIKDNPIILRHLFWAINILACGFILIDCVSGYSLTFLIDPVSADESLNERRADAEMNIGHSVTILLLFIGVMSTSLIQRFKYGWVLASLYFMFLIWASHIADLQVGILVSILIFFTLLASKVSPLKTLELAVLIAVMSIILPPIAKFILPYLETETLPLSWQHRTAMWEYTANKIWDAPLWGHGFDAVRTFDETMTLGLVDDWPIVSLHPHNAGLHIWVETGFIGVILASLTLVLFGREALSIARTSSGFAMALSAVIMAATIISAVTYGVWQHWWWASVIFSNILVYMCFIEK